MTLFRSRCGWLALALLVLSQAVGTVGVRADDRAASKPQKSLEPAFDPVFTGGAARPGVGTKVGSNKSRPGTKVAGRPSSRQPGRRPAPGVGFTRPAPVVDDLYPVPDPKKVQNVVAVQDKHKAEIHQQKGVLGTSTALLDTGEIVVRVYTNGIDKPQLPKTLQGIRVEEMKVGQVHPRALPLRQQRLARPVPIGVSAFYWVTGTCGTGTYGARLIGSDNVIYGLSNNHVFALENAGVLGNPIIQPGQLDEYQARVDQLLASGIALDDIDLTCDDVFAQENVIGDLYQFVPIVFADDGANLVDAAVIKSTAAYIGNTTLGDGYGTPTGTVVPAFLGQRVQKYGRTTGYKDGIVTALNKTIIVGYDAGDAQFINQFEVTGIPDTDAFSASGDSGSLVVDMNRNPVGLLFAGGGFPIDRTDCNPIQTVLNQLGSLIGTTLDVDGRTFSIPPGKIGVGVPVAQPWAVVVP